MTNQKQNAPGGGSLTLRAEKPADAEARMLELAKREGISIEEARSKFAVPGALQFGGIVDNAIAETEVEDDE